MGESGCVGCRGGVGRVEGGVRKGSCGGRLAFVLLLYVIVPTQFLDLSLTASFSDPTTWS